MTRPIASLLSLVVFFLVIVLPTPASASSVDSGQAYLSFEERVSYREAVEDVLWSHRIWPEENPAPKPARHEIKSREQIVVDVEESLLFEAALNEFWGESLTEARIQAELDRIGRSTKRPEILLEIFAALDNDPLLVAECFVRPQLAKRLAHQRYDLEVTGTSVSEQQRVGFSTWWEASRLELTPELPDAGTYTLPGVLKCRFCNDDGWTPAPGLPDFEMFDRRDHTAVWTGTEMIVWGGESMTGIKTDIGGRYDPITDTWTPTTTTGAPSERRDHTAVWTGTEMIVWGGFDTFFITNGGRYNPTTDTWMTVSTIGAAAGSVDHSAVWTGTEMIVWGGTDSSYASLDTGGRYDPTTDSWTATTTTGAPVARDKHHALWIGAEMIVWGGKDESNNETNTGGRYDPATDSWTATSTVGPPSARYGESAAWTGTEMIIWGGVSGGYSNTGGRYDPVADSWSATTITGAPTGRQNHSAVWSGTEMIIWGGNDQNTGGRYDPATDTWTATSTTDAPSGRSLHEAVWTGTEMIIWGKSSWAAGELGKRYDPTTDSWTAMNQQITAPTGRSGHSAVWLGTEMIIWGGANSDYADTGSTYSLLTDSWAPINATGAPPGRTNHSVVWTGTEMIVWGGYSSSALNSGGRYNPSTDTWAATSLTGAPSARAGHAAVWSGTEMIIWAGSYVNTGGKYNPATDTWTPTSLVNAPPGLTGFGYVWTGDILVVWGGQIPGQPGGTYANWGGRYNAAANMWFSTSTVGAPSARVGATATWTGSEVIIWGGYTAQSADLYPTVGGRYNPYTDSWITMGSTGAPPGRYYHTALWTGSEFLVWGGDDGDPVGTGGRYDPLADTWFMTNNTNAASARSYHASVWTGSELLLWGGGGSSNSSMRNGGLYCASGVSDHVPPTDPYISGAAPVPGSWTSDDTILVFWSGSTDADSGVAGYSVVMDQNPLTTPDDTVELSHSADPHSIEMPAVASGDDWVFHVKACDNAGNCSAGIHFGPYWIDTTVPTAPGAVTSASHDGGSPVSDSTIDTSWGASTDDHSGVSTYRYEFNQSPIAPACTAIYDTTGTTSISSWTLADGTWYLHVCAQDVALNPSGVTTGGPYVIDTTAPSNPSSLASSSHTVGAWSQTSVIAMQWSGASDANGVSGYSLLFDLISNTQPDSVQEVPHTTDPHGAASGAVADGNTHYFHLSTCDQAGTCTTALHTGPYSIDATAPGVPGPVSSVSHGGGPSSDATIDVTWGSAVDATSLVDGYSFTFNGDASWICDATKEVEEDATGATSSPLVQGDWYFHVCAVDHAGNWGAVTSGGPFVVDTPLIPPTVTVLSTVADTGDGSLGEGEQVDAPLTQFLVSFSATMNDPAGDTWPGDVTNPTSYRLVGDGGDGTVATLNCSAVDSSDVAVTISQVIYDDVSDTASLQLEGEFALSQGTYAVFACGSEGLSDEVGSPLDGTGNGTGGDDFRIGFSVTHNSLVLNPNLDDDAADWIYDGPVSSTMTYSTADSGDAGTSGSLLLTGTAIPSDVLQAQQCVALSESGAYRAAGRARITSSFSYAPMAKSTITLFDLPNCQAGSELSVGRSSLVFGDTGGDWADLGAPMAWADSAVSAMVSFTIDPGDSPDVDAGFDALNMWFVPGVFFADGFEMGDTSNWSATAGE